MKRSELTDSNPILEVNSRYCQLLLEDIYFPYLETEGRNDKYVNWLQDASEVSTTVYEPENMKANFEIVGRIFGRFCEYLAPPVEEQSWTFANLTGILWRGQSSGEYLVSSPAPLRNIYDRILMYYLDTSGLLSLQKYSENDVNIYKEVLIRALTIVNPSTNTSLVSWLAGAAETRRKALSDDFTWERVEQVVEKPWREIQQVYSKILSELREMPAVHLENLSQISSRALYFCFQQQLLRFLPIALDIIGESFSIPTNEVMAETEKDSETEEEWLEFKVRIRGEIEDVLSRYDKYTERLVSLLPSSARYKMRLSYKIV